MNTIPGHRSSIVRAISLLVLMAASTAASAATQTVNSTSNDASVVGTLPYWLLNAADGDTIDCSGITGQQITLAAPLPAITKSYTINGAGITIDGAGAYPAFQVAAGTVSISNITVQNALSKGGNGGSGYSGGGGGVGGGGALYLHGGVSVTLTAASLVGNAARGGNGGNADNNGNGGGQFSGLQLAANGNVIAQYSNGSTKVMGTIALANFQNPQGLVAIPGNNWLASTASGQAVINPPGTAGLGSLEAGALEGSNVDLSTQLVNLIVAQQAYQANVQGINVDQQDVQKLLQLQ